MGMLPRDLVTIMVLISLGAVMSSVYLDGINDNYAVNIDNSWVSTYNKIDNASALTSNYYSKINTTDQGMIPDTVELLWTGTVDIIKLVINSLSIISEIISGLLLEIGLSKTIADPLGAGINVMFLSAIIFAIISSVLKKEI